MLRNMLSGGTDTDVCSTTDSHALTLDFRAVELENILETQSSATTGPEKSRSQITEASVALADHGRPSIYPTAASPKPPSEVPDESVRRKHSLTEAQLIQLGSSLLSQNDPNAIEDLHSIVGDLRRQNNRLKRRLQEYESDPVPLPERTLFEVETSGLDVHQKHELLEILLGFACGLSPHEASGLSVHSTRSQGSSERQDTDNHFVISHGHS